MEFDRKLIREVKDVLDRCRDGGLMLATVESCTGGLLAAALTGIPGASDVVERGFVTYSNDAKSELLGVPPELIERHGAVSEPVARAMAEGALARSRANLGISITGVAGPSGGTALKPVGLVYLACAAQGRETIVACKTYGPRGRGEIRRLAVSAALAMLANQAQAALAP